MDEIFYDNKKTRFSDAFLKIINRYFREEKRKKLKFELRSNEKSQ